LFRFVRELPGAERTCAVNVAVEQRLAPDIEPLREALNSFPLREVGNKKFLDLIDNIKAAAHQIESGVNFIYTVPDSCFTAAQLREKRKMEAAIKAHLDDCRTLLSRAERLQTGWFRGS
jgi:hypothetical protein